MKNYTTKLPVLALLIFLLLAFIFSACSTPTPVVQTVEVTRLVPEVLVATYVVEATVLVTVESAIELPTAAPLVATQTPLASSTLAATPARVMVFSNGKINSFGFRSDATFFVTVDTGQTLSGDYKAQVGQEEYFCELVPNYPERIYCYGPLTQYGKILTLRIFTDDESKTMLFETEFMAPLKSTVTPTPTITLTATPTSP